MLLKRWSRRTFWKDCCCCCPSSSSNQSLISSDTLVAVSSKFFSSKVHCAVTWVMQFGDASLILLPKRRFAGFDQFLLLFLGRKVRLNWSHTERCGDHASRCRALGGSSLERRMEGCCFRFSNEMVVLEFVDGVAVAIGIGSFDLGKAMAVANPPI